MYAAHFLPKLGYAKRTHLMNAMVPGLSGGKMSSSDPQSKIDFLDSPQEIRNKLKGAFCSPGVVADNGVLAFLKTVLIPVQAMRVEQRGQENARGPGTFVALDAPQGTVFSIARPDKFGGPIHYASYAAIEDAYAKEELHPDDLKSGVAAALVELLAPISKMFNEDAEWQAAERLAYPDASVSAKALAAKVKKAPAKASVRSACCEYTATDFEL
jgi:tyrosyl-tRNA synthetase